MDSDDNARQKTGSTYSMTDDVSGRSKLTPREVAARERYWTGIGVLVLAYTFAGAQIVLSPSVPGKELPLMRQVRGVVFLLVFAAVFWTAHGAGLGLITESAEYSDEPNWLQEWLA